MLRQTSSGQQHQTNSLSNTSHISEGIIVSAKNNLTQDDIKKSIDNGHIRISDWRELHEKLETMHDSGWIFRGAASPKHYLLPSIGREGVYGHYKLAQEQRLFDEFKNRAIALISDSRLDDWDWLAYAQHIGVPTRLLDWSVNPLVALYFALEAESDSDRIVYAVKYSKYIHEVDHRNTSPFEGKKEGRFTAPPCV